MLMRARRDANENSIESYLKRLGLDDSLVQIFTLVLIIIMGYIINIGLGDSSILGFEEEKFQQQPGIDLTFNKLWSGTPRGPAMNSPVEAIRNRRARRAAARILGPEHKVIDEELRLSKVVE
jgi:hypothetical protein